MKGAPQVPRTSLRSARDDKFRAVATMEVVWDGELIPLRLRSQASRGSKTEGTC